jgi:hypothetical protein
MILFEKQGGPEILKKTDLILKILKMKIKKRMSFLFQCEAAPNIHNCHCG